jgi:hypothetical protein
MAQPAPRNGFGVTGLGLVFGLVPFTGFLALILVLLAVLFGLLGWSRARRGTATNRTMTVLGTVLGIGSIGILFGAVEELGKDPQHAAAVLGDVAVVGCSVTGEGGVSSVHATVRITNRTDQTQRYLATIGVNDASGAPIGRINTASSPLAAGRSVTLSGREATGTAAGGARLGSATCVVANVNRIPATIACPPGAADPKFC